MTVNVSKNRKKVIDKIDRKKVYSLSEAIKLIKETSFTKFNSTIEIAIRLGVDPKKSDQMVRGTVSLPYGIGKEVKVLVLCNTDQEKEAKEAGADLIGLDEYIEKISKGWTDFDVMITIPLLMPKIAKLGKILGPRNLMPNPKSGTVTNELSKTIKEAKAGRIDFKIDKSGIIHTIVGKVSFNNSDLEENAKELLHTVFKLKPPSSKGTYFKSVSLSSTMGAGLFIDVNEIIAN